MRDKLKLELKYEVSLICFHGNEAKEMFWKKNQNGRLKKLSFSKPPILAKLRAALQMVPLVAVLRTTMSTDK